jgi:AAA family ATP:ADP antiporter
MLNLLRKLCKFNFGDFEEQEFRKFLRMGMIFMIIIGCYWTLRPLKDAVFIQFVGGPYIPYAKTVSVLLMIPFVGFYTKLVGKFNKEKMLTMLPIFYGVLVLLFAIVVHLVQAEVYVGQVSTAVLGFIWYFFVESYGSLLPALFWAVAADVTDPKTAKRGFALIYAFGQFGGVIAPYAVGGLPHRLGLSTDFISMAILGFLITLVVVLVKRFFRVTPKELLSSYAHDKIEEKDTNGKKPSFIEGLKLLCSNKYLIAMFAANFFFEFIVTIFDFSFKIAAGNVYKGVELSNYLSIYGSSVNIVSCLCLLLGVSNVTRFLGVGAALAIMPIVLGTALVGFLSMDSLNFLFALMVGSKAINYALNGPALKQLYIPTTKDVHFKAQAWIETFGSRASKEAGSIVNMAFKPLQNAFGVVSGKAYFMAVSGTIGFCMVGIWFFVALYLGKTFKKAINENTVVC